MQVRRVLRAGDLEEARQMCHQQVHPAACSIWDAWGVGGSGAQTGGVGDRAYSSVRTGVVQLRGGACGVQVT